MPRPANNQTCKFEGCGEPYYALGWCRKHHSRARHTGGDPTPAPQLTTEERFFAKVEKRGECWAWTGAVNPGGYGVFFVEWQDRKSRTQLAHRWAYEFLVGPIPAGLTLDHLKDRCSTTLCVNPDHLDPCPGVVNVQRGDHSQPRREWCKAGLHPLEGKNVIIRPSKPTRRECRECANEAKRRRRAAAK